MKSVFVFGSNREGRHGKGAALDAVKNHGAIYGRASGIQGGSYAIITKELRKFMPAVSIEEVKKGVDEFIAFAKNNPDMKFYITPIGCGLAGFVPSQIGPMFDGAPANCVLPKEFK
jgi:hypothetical protein